MNILNSKLFFNQTVSTGTSEVLGNIRGDLLVSEVYGTATAFSLKVQGIMDTDNLSSWTDIGWYNSVFEKGTNIVSKGIYTIPIYSIFKTRIVISSISGGNLTVFGKVGE